MSLMWMFYWIDTIDSLINLFTFLGISGLIIATISFIFYLGNRFNIDSSHEDNPSDPVALVFKKIFKVTLPIGIIFIILSILAPSKETSYKMVAASAAQTVYESKEAKEVGNKLLSLINKKLDELSDSPKGKGENKK